jgi:AcrR family transcriptional regulator
MNENPKDPEHGEKRRTPKQLRGVETRNSILEAAISLFSERGYQQTTTHQIAKQAGVSVGALYRYFSDKEDILKELYRQEVTAMRNRILEGFSVVDVVTKDARDLVRTALHLAFSIYSERPALWRVLLEQSRRIPELAAIRRSQELELYQTVQQILRSVPNVRLADIEASAYMISLFLESFILDYILYRRDHVEFGDERIIDVAVDFIMHYVLNR